MSGPMREISTNDWGEKPANMLLEEFEQTAVTRHQYDHFSIPPLLQTPEYAAAILKAQGSSDIDLGVHHIRERQRFHAENGTLCTFFIPQAVLDVRVDDTWEKQQEHLITESCGPNTVIRIIPREQFFKAHPAVLVQTSSCRRQVYLESPIHKSCLSDGKDMLHLSAIMFYRLGEVALSEFESAELLRNS